MSKPLRIVIIDCYDTDGQLGLQRSGATLGGRLYQKLLDALVPDAQTEIYNIALLDPDPLGPEKYDGACWTGSNLFLSADNPASASHINLCHAFFDRGIPQFGSCWGAQLACATAGGTIEANPLGREFGYITDIVKTEAGKAHPMLQGKPDRYACFASHRDSITVLPEQTLVLSGNAHSAVQSLDVRFLNGHFWATQYHSEYDYAEMSRLAQTRKQALVNDGVFAVEADVDLFSDELSAYQSDTGRNDLEIKHRFDPAMRHPEANAHELKNWLAHFFDR